MSNNFYETEGYSDFSEEFIRENLFGKSRLNVFLNEIEKIMDKKNNLKILDIGCGEGAFIEFLRKKYPANSYYGSDISKSAIESAIKKYPDVGFDVNDFNEITSYTDGFFDLLTCGEVIEHLHNTDVFFQEIKRITKENGYVVISTPNLSSWIGRIMLLFGYLPPSMEVSVRGRHFGRKIFYRRGNTKAVGHIKSFTWRALRDLSRYHGFKVIEHKGAWFRGFILNKLMTRLCPSLSQQQIIVLMNSYNPDNKA